MAKRKKDKNIVEKVDSSESEISYGEYYEKFVCFLAILLSFLLPLKFSSIVAIPEATMLYADNLFDWMIITWPPLLFSVTAGLFATLTLFLPPKKGASSSPWICVFIWVALAFIGVIGAYKASTYDFMALEIVHLFSLAAYALGMFAILSRRPKMKNWLLFAVVLGTMLSAFYGWSQLNEGFEETRNYAYQMELKSGIKQANNFKTRLMENRVFSTFSLCNSFAAHLLLTIPICFWAIWTAAGRVDPPKVSRAIFIPLLAILLLPMLYHTNSRAAILALGLAFLAAIIFLPTPRALRLTAVLALPLIIVLGVFTVSLGRGLGSMEIRFDYFWAAIRMFFQSPIFGTGWGDFFHEYMRLKLYLCDEAPHTPHSLVLAFASQVGILGLIGALAALFYPFWILRRKISRSINESFKNSDESTINDSISIKYWLNLILENPRISRDLAIFLGVTAWGIHSFAEINLQIAGTACTAMLLILIALIPEEGEGIEVKSSLSHRKLLLFWYPASIAVILVLFVWGGRLLAADHAYSRLHSLCDPRYKTREEYFKVAPWEMKAALDRCVKLNPRSPFPLMQAAIFLANRGRFDIAEELYQKAIELSPERASNYYRIYTIQLQMGKKDKARESLRRAVELFPAHSKYAKELDALNPSGPYLR